MAPLSPISLLSPDRLTNLRACRTDARLLVYISMSRPPFSFASADRFPPHRHRLPSSRQRQPPSLCQTPAALDSPPSPRYSSESVSYTDIFASPIFDLFASRVLTRTTARSPHKSSFELTCWVTPTRLPTATDNPSRWDVQKPHSA